MNELLKLHLKFLFSMIVRMWNTDDICVFIVEKLIFIVSYFFKFMLITFLKIKFLNMRIKQDKSRLCRE